MDDSLCVIFIILIIWLIIYLMLEFSIINNKKNEVKKIFLEIDELFEKRISILLKMVDIVKGYDKNQFDDLGSRLYDYSTFYKEYDVNKRIEVNHILDGDVKKILLATKVYPELTDVVKYVKFEKQLIRYSKVIKKLKFKYNKVLDDYNNRKRIFPSGIISIVCKFYDYNRFTD